MDIDNLFWPSAFWAWANDGDMRHIARAVRANIAMTRDESKILADILEGNIKRSTKGGPSQKLQLRNFMRNESIRFAFQNNLAEKKAAKQANRSIRMDARDSAIEETAKQFLRSSATIRGIVDRTNVLPPRFKPIAALVKNYPQKP